MANTIDLLTEVKTPTANTTVVDTNTIKEQPSLFDSLLKNSIESKINNAEVNTTTAVIKPTEPTITDNSQVLTDILNPEETQTIKISELENKLNLEIKNNSENKLVEENSSIKINPINSLLDRLVLEAKSEVKETKINSLDNSNPTKSIVINQTNEVDLENKNEDVLIVKNNNLEINTTTNNKDLKTIEPLLTNEKIISSSLNPEEILVVEENPEVQNKINIETQQILQTKETVELKDNKDKTIDILETKEVLEVKNNSESEVLKDKNSLKIDSSGSLLDRLVIQAKNEVKESKVNNLELTAATNVLNIIEPDIINNDEILIDNVNKEQIVISNIPEMKIKVNTENKEVENKSLNNIIVSDETIKTQTVSNPVDLVEVIVENEKEVLKQILNIETLDKSVKNIEQNINTASPSLTTPSIVTVKEADSVLNTSLEATDVVRDTTTQNIDVVSEEKLVIDLNSNKVAPEQTKSLMDQLIQKNTKVINETDLFTEDTLNTPKNSLVNEFVSNIYLGSQKNSLNTQTLFNKSEAITLLKDGASVKDIQTSANILELGLEDINIEQKVDVEDIVQINKKVDLDNLTRRNLIDRLLLEKNVKSVDVKNLITTSVEASNALLENSLNLADEATLNINSPLSYNIQSKIIGARQQMSTMMSDIAKQMYENYKPPVTAFRINLNPLELGSIAILMKADRNNALTISMSVSNSGTLDALVENQNVLRNSLNKTFDENTKFNLDFNSSNENSNSSSNNQGNQNNQNRRFENQMDTQSVLQLKEENKDREEKSIDYM